MTDDLNPDTDPSLEGDPVARSQEGEPDDGLVPENHDPDAVDLSTGGAQESESVGVSPDSLPSQGMAATPEEVEEAVVGAEMESGLDQLQLEFNELNDKHLRLAADYTNFRRRAETERSASWDRAQSDLLRHMLDALDDLQRVGGLEAEATTVESLVEGVDLVERKFRQALETAGVEVIDPVGEPFDPNIMEGMMRVPTDVEEKDDVVQAVYQKGYSLNGHLVRPARVSVFKHG